MICIILAGGSGTRLFPLSRKNYPKQFIPFFNDRSLFEMTINRFDKNDEIFIVANQSSLSYFNQMKSMINRPITLILEPEARNTSVAIIYSLLIIENLKSGVSDQNSGVNNKVTDEINIDKLAKDISAGEDPNKGRSNRDMYFRDELNTNKIIGVFPADHLIEDMCGFRSTIALASNFTRESICLIGIEPTRAETGYGYIEYKDNDVLSFKEKPSFQLANSYLQRGGFLWNAGMFLFNNNIFWKSLSKNNPQIFKLAINLKEEVFKQKSDFTTTKNEANNNISIINDLLSSLNVASQQKANNNINIIKPSKNISSIYNQFPNISIDFALIEKTDNLKVVKAKFDWDDLGNLQSVAEKVNRSICLDWGKYIFTQDEIAKRKNFENENIFIYNNNFSQNTDSFQQTPLKSNDDKVKTLSNSLTKGICSFKSLELESNEVNKHEDDVKSGNLVFGLPDKKYAFIDIKDLILFDTRDVLLLMKKREKDSSSQNMQNIPVKKNPYKNQREQNMKEQISSNQIASFQDKQDEKNQDKKLEPIIAFFDHIKKTQPEITESHKIVSRPWGFYDQLFEKKNEFQIKIISINAGESLSLQYHDFRDEEWIILSGSGKIRIEDKIFRAKISDHFSIKKKEKHQVIAEDDGITILEVQFGENLDEKDIVRLEDKYGRS